MSGFKFNFQLKMKLLKQKKFKIKKIIKDQKTIRVIEKGENFDFFSRGIT